MLACDSGRPAKTLAGDRDACFDHFLLSSLLAGKELLALYLIAILQSAPSRETRAQRTASSQGLTMSVRCLLSPQRESMFITAILMAADLHDSTAWGRSKR